MLKRACCAVHCMSKECEIDLGNLFSTSPHGRSRQLTATAHRHLLSPAKTLMSQKPARLVFLKTATKYEIYEIKMMWIQRHVEYCKGLHPMASEFAWEQQTICSAAMHKHPTCNTTNKAWRAMEKAGRKTAGSIFCPRSVQTLSTDIALGDHRTPRETRNGELASFHRNRVSSNSSRPQFSIAPCFPGTATRSNFCSGCCMPVQLV